MPIKGATVRRARPSLALAIEDEVGGFIRKPSIGAVSALVGIVLTAISGVVGYRDLQNSARTANDGLAAFRTEYKEDRAKRESESEKSKVSQAADLEKYKTATTADLERFKTAQAAELEKFRIETNASVERAKAAGLLETSKLAGRVDKQGEKLDGINDGGTAYGRSAYSSQNVEKANMKKDLDELQTTVRALVPAVARIEAKIDTWGQSGPAPGQTLPRGRNLSTR